MKKLKNYFSHDFNARNDIKLKKVNMELGMNGIGLYWCIIECLYENNGYLDLDQIDLLAYELRVEKKLIDNLINNYDLFKKNKKSFYSKSVLQRLEKINEISNKNKENARKRWKNRDKKTNVQSECKNDATAMRLECKKKEKKIKENKNKINNNIITTTNDINIYDYISNNFGRLLTPIELEKIDIWIKEFEDNQIIKYAVEIAVMRCKKTFSYVEGILKNWKGQNFKTLQEIKDNEFKIHNTETKDLTEIFDYDWLNETDEN
ncbi:MAG: DnaD domain protein [Bacilli bacterium]